MVGSSSLFGWSGHGRQRVYSSRQHYCDQVGEVARVRGVREDPLPVGAFAHLPDRAASRSVATARLTHTHRDMRGRAVIPSSRQQSRASVGSTVIQTTRSPSIEERRPTSLASHDALGPHRRLAIPCVNTERKKPGSKQLGEDAFTGRPIEPEEAGGLAYGDLETWCFFEFPHEWLERACETTVSASKGLRSVGLRV